MKALFFLLTWPYSPGPRPATGVDKARIIVLKSPPESLDEDLQEVLGGCPTQERPPRRDLLTALLSTLRSPFLTAPVPPTGVDTGRIIVADAPFESLDEDLQEVLGGRPTQEQPPRPSAPMTYLLSLSAWRFPTAGAPTNTAHVDTGRIIVADAPFESLDEDLQEVLGGCPTQEQPPQPPGPMTPLPSLSTWAPPGAAAPTNAATVDTGRILVAEGALEGLDEDLQEVLGGCTTQEQPPRPKDSAPGPVPLQARA